MKKLSVALSSVIIVAALPGCAIYGDTVSEVVPLGPDTYVVSSGGHDIISTPGSIRIKAIKEASKFCAAQGKNFRISNFTSSSTGPWVDHEAEVQFMCLDKGDRDLTRPVMEKGADITIDVK